MQMWSFSWMTPQREKIWLFCCTISIHPYQIMFGFSEKYPQTHLTINRELHTTGYRPHLPLIGIAKMTHEVCDAQTWNDLRIFRRRRNRRVNLAFRIPKQCTMSPKNLCIVWSLPKWAFFYGPCKDTVEILGGFIKKASLKWQKWKNTPNSNSKFIAYVFLLETKKNRKLLVPIVFLT